LGDPDGDGLGGFLQRESNHMRFHQAKKGTRDMILSAKGGHYLNE